MLKVGTFRDDKVTVMLENETGVAEVSQDTVGAVPVVYSGPAAYFLIGMILFMDATIATSGFYQ